MRIYMFLAENFEFLFSCFAFGMCVVALIGAVRTLVKDLRNHIDKGGKL